MNKLLFIIELMLLLKNYPASKNRAPIYHESAKSLRPGHSVSYLFPSLLALRCVFVVNANIDSGKRGAEYCMKKHGSSYPQLVPLLRVSGIRI